MHSGDELDMCKEYFNGHFGRHIDGLIIIIIIMVIFKCYFSGEHIALSIKKRKKKQQQRCEHRLRKNQQTRSTVHDAN